jgi:uncharacterized protein YegP (UPF0339 family)
MKVEVKRNQYNEWSFKVMRDDGEVVCTSKSYLGRDECLEALHWLRGRLPATIETIQPRPTELREGKRIDEDE